ncbi:MULTISPECIES: DUF4190 domain-containing protein [unclassified Nocardioides]|uniref:DUF4190 domain-containing protein n=1 Tax=unclassified Nocardioides TaxID=2615069 RepID=UPI0009F0C522|nr:MULTISPECIES: DUF4190 domain-containing protein [unclassified Nocardioides]GAW48928.1 uncharacterized protein PD653B2_1246 [Nocardioides sp. PD653-B2]GAW54565.1 uncharacterized protein PD653_1976 [Nocardioides sp. PD653]
MSSSDPGPGPEQPGPYGGGAPPPYQPNPYAQQPYQQTPYQQPYGAPPPSGYPPYQQTPPTEGLGLAAMIVGIVSLVLSCGYGVGLLGSPAALIMGRISMKRIDRSEGQLGGRGLAMTGFILGIVGTVLLVLAIIAVVVVIVVAVNGGFDDTTFTNS